MARTWRAARVVVCALTTLGLLQACGLRNSTIITRPSGHVNEDAGPDVPGIDGGLEVFAQPAKRDASADEPPQGVDCEGTEQQVNDCIINAPTKSGISATRGKPTLTYQTCGAK
jgi:hypothetical protein